MENFREIFLTPSIFLASGTLAWFFNALLFRFISKRAKKNDYSWDDRVLPILKILVQMAILWVALSPIFELLGISISTILAGSAVGFTMAIKDLLANLVWGVMNLILGNFTEGDTFETHNQKFNGKIISLNLFEFVIELKNGRILSLPNEILFGMAYAPRVRKNNSKHAKKDNAR